MAIANYVLKRGSRFVWRRRLPGRQVVQISLLTSDSGRARHLAGLVTAFANDIIQDMGVRLTAGEAKGLFNRVVREETAAIEGRYLRRRAMRLRSADQDWPAELIGMALIAALRNGEVNDSDRKAMANMGFGEPDKDDASYQAWVAFMEIARTAAAPFSSGHAETLARETVEAELRLPDQIDREQLLPAYRLILAARAAALMPCAGIGFETAAQTHPADALDPDKPLLPVDWLAATLPVKAPQPETGRDALQDGPVRSAKWDDVVEDYVQNQHRNHIKPAEQQQTRVTARLFSEATGICDVRFIRQAHLARFRDALRDLPRHYGRSAKDRGLTVPELLAKADLDPTIPRGLSPGTVNGHLATINAILNLSKVNGITAYNALDFGGLRLKDPVRKRDKRPPFSFDDVERIFSHPLWQGAKSSSRRRQPGKVITKDGQYWIPLIAAYTGARREDIAALTVRDICDADGIMCFDIRENENRDVLKTLATRRLIPVHPHLIELGFQDHIAAAQGNLFPELKRKHKNAGLGSAISYSFDRVLDDQIGKDRGGKCFYSFRHYVTQELRNNQVAKEVRRDILGHEGQDLEDEVYGDDTPVPLKYEAICKLRRVF